VVELVCSTVREGVNWYPIQISWYLTKIVHENQRKFQKKCCWG
jgi:hypothetical protein